VLRLFNAFGPLMMDCDELDLLLRVNGLFDANLPRCAFN
jgi:hypothetical protein